MTTLSSGVRTTTATVDGAVYRRRRISKSMFITTSVDDDHDEEKRTEQNLIVYVAANLKRNLRSTYCIIEATDRHKAARGLSATAGLFVFIPLERERPGIYRRPGVY